LKKLLYIFIILFATQVNAQVTSNKGTDFWVTYANHYEGSNSQMALYITSDVNTSGTVSIPGKSWSTTYTVSANSITIISIPQTFAIMNCTECTQSKGINVTSVDPVVVYSHIYYKNKSDATLVLPTETAGREYYVMGATQMKTGYNNTTGVYSASQFQIIGLYDSTEIEITPTAGSINSAHSKGSTFNIYLNKGEVYQYQSDTDLTGTYITSVTSSGTNCKRIAVFAGSTWTPLGCSGAGTGDNLYQQLYPVSAWGKSFATAPWKTRTGGDVYRVLASVNSTKVTINNYNTQTLSAGQYYEWMIDSAQYIIADQPICLAQYQRTQSCDNVTGDPSMTILSPIEQQLSNITLYSSPYYQISGHYINILMESDDTSNFYLDNNKVIWKTIPANTTYAYSQTAVSSGNHTLIADSGFNAIAYGFGNIESYGYSAGANIVNLVQHIELGNTKECKGRSVSFKGFCVYTPIKWKWTFGDGGTDTVQNPYHIYQDTGTFIATLVTLKSNGNDCSSQDSTIYTVKISMLPVADFTYDNSCSKGDVNFYDKSSIANGSITKYYWEFGDGSYATSKNTTHHYNNTGNYTVKLMVTSASLCDSTISKTITVNETPAANFNITQICYPDTIVLFDSSTLGNVYKTNYSCSKAYVRWGDGTVSDTFYNQIGNQNFKHKYNTYGTYSVTIIVNDCYKTCVDSFTKSVIIYDKPKPKFVLSNTCQKDSFTIIDSSSIAYGSITQWDWTFGDATTKTYTSKVSSFKKAYTNNGVYLISLKVYNANACYDTVSQYITIYPKPKPGFTFGNVCYPFTATFNDTSTITSGSIVYKRIYFGDGKDSIFTSSSVGHTFTTAGTYTVKLYLESNMGCKDSVSKSIVIYPKPTVNFTVTNSCLNDSVPFTESSSVSSGSITKRYYDFGDGDTITYFTTKSSFKKLYQDTGIYAVQLIIYTDKGCSDSVSKNVYIAPLPTPVFSTLNVCYQDTASFYDSTNIYNTNIIKWTWDWGDAQTTTYTTYSSSVKHYYSTSGIYKVVLKITNTTNCYDTFSQYLQIYKKPFMGFTAINNCLNDSVIFTDTSISADGQIISRNWDFGDASTSNGNDSIVKHHYNSIGNKTVKLVEISQYGCKQTYTKNITIDTVPVPAFSNTTGCAKDSIIFTNASTIKSGSISNYQWIWDDTTTSAVTNSSNIKHGYWKGGYKNVSLIAYSAKGCRDTLTKKIYINPRPNVTFSTPGICFKDSVTFVDYSTLDSGSITLWRFDFGDGNQTTYFSKSNLTHKYATPNTYPVKMYIETTWGCADSATAQFVVNSSPVAKISWDKLCKNDFVLFIDSTYMAYGSVLKWFWKFGDSYSDTLKNPLHKYADTGTYTVSLKVKSGNLCEDSTTTKVYINLNPLTKFTLSNICEDDTVVVNIQSSLYNNPLLYYVCNWGDGSIDTSTSSKMKHGYSNWGYYPITVNTLSIYSCGDTLTKYVYIRPKPIPTFNFNQVCIYDSLYLIDSSFIPRGNIIQWKWDWGDGNQTTKNTNIAVAHKYNAPGKYSVSLLLSSDSGCSDIKYDTVEIYPVPKPKIYIADSSQCEPMQQFNFIDTSTIAYGYYSRVWDFGDGNTDTNKTITHTYATYGNYTVKLKLKSVNGCEDSTTQSIIVYETPKPRIYYTIADSCEQTDIINLYDSTTSKTVTWNVNWTFGDGNNSNAFNPVHHYNASGSYKVQLYITSLNGCVDSITQNIIVHANPVVQISTNNNCFGDSSVFVDLSSVSVGTIAKRVWYFGDGDSLSTNKTTISHLYKVFGSYQVILKCTTNKLCEWSDTQTIVIQPKPNASFYQIQNCVNDSVVFVDQSTVSTGKLVSRLMYFGDGDSSYFSDTLLKHKYINSGNYISTIKIISDSGCSDIFTKNIIIYPKPSAKVFAANACLNNVVAIYDSSSGIYPIGYRYYSFGDGMDTVTDQSIFFHQYTTSGYNTITQIVQNSVGCFDTNSITIYIYPLPKFNIKNTNACAFELMRFNDSTTIDSGGFKQFVWDFGDNSGKLYSPKNVGVGHIYNYGGIYNISVATQTGFGCTDSFNFSVYINYSPEPKFIADDVCVGDSTIFSDLSTIPRDTIKQWDWDFGDGKKISYNTFSSLFSHLYDTAGNFLVKLTCTSSSNCKKDYTSYITVHDIPHIKYKIDSYRGCLPLTINFKDKSYNSTDSIVSYAWDFGDGYGSVLQSPIHTFRKSKLYTVSLKLVSAFGCINSFIDSTPIFPYPLPKAIINAFPDSTPSLQALVQFSNLSFQYIQGKWDFGDGTTSTLTNPFHHYEDTGAYNSQLVVKNHFGCYDTAYKRIFIMPDFTFYVPNTFTPNDDDLNETFGPKGLFKGIIHFQMTVWNRWGGVVFETTDINNQWNGTFRNQGVASPMDVYIYRMEYQDYFGRKHNSANQVHLIR